MTTPTEVERCTRCGREKHPSDKTWVGPHSTAQLCEICGEMADNAETIAKFMATPSDAARALQRLSVAARKRDPRKLSDQMKRVRAAGRHYRSCESHSGGACTCAAIRSGVSREMFHAPRCAVHIPDHRYGRPYIVTLWGVEYWYERCHCSACGEAMSRPTTAPADRSSPPAALQGPSA